MSPAPYRPIAIGFVLLSLPLFVSVLLSEQAVGRWSNGGAGLVMLVLGLALFGRRR